jgi:hypothetical protein
VRWKGGGGRVEGGLEWVMGERKGKEKKKRKKGGRKEEGGGGESMSP